MPMSQSLLQDLTDIEERVRAAPRISLFLDFDGTLVPLVGDPEEPLLDESTRKILARISRIDRMVTTIISGRAIVDLRSRVGLEGLIYAGNHGLEICARELRFVEPTAAARQEDLRELCGRLARTLEAVPGAIVEYKGLTASVHYRRVAVRELARIEDLVQASVSSAAESFYLRSDKMAIEILPRTGWHKGKAAAWINQRLGNGPVLPIYLGDGNTDEDAFRALPEGITVKVGSPAPSAARYHLADPPAVYEFLIRLAKYYEAA